MAERCLEVRRLGRVAYADGLELQKRLESGVINDRDRDYLLLLEHPHTFTIGRRSKNESVLATADMLRKLGVDVFEINRGGKVTYHGIGQVVGYPIISLSPDREDVHRYVRDLEEVLIRTMSEFGIEAFRIEGLTGVHTAEGKIAAIGVHIKRWVTTHGFALNVNTDLSYYNWIIACEGEPVTSMGRLLDREVDIAEVEDRIVANFESVFGYKSALAVTGALLSVPPVVAGGSDKNPPDTAGGTEKSPVATAPGSDSGGRRSHVHEEAI